MLPNFIINHPYFHSNLDKSTAIEHLKNLPTNENGYSLFCRGESENEFVYVFTYIHKTIKDGSPIILVDKLFEGYINFTYINPHIKFGGSSHPGTSMIYTLDCLDLNLLKIRIDNYFSKSSRPILINNSTIMKSQIDIYDFFAMPPLPNAATNIVFNCLDIQSKLNIARVSKSCFALFNANIISIINDHNIIISNKEKISNQERQKAIWQNRGRITRNGKILE